MGSYLTVTSSLIGKTKNPLMKTIIILAVLVLCLNNNVPAQQAEVSAKILNSFQKQFPGATSVKWEATKTGLRSALFQYEQRTWIAYFDPSGDLVASARKIKEISHLPMAVQASLRNFQDQKAAKMGPLTLGPVYEVVEKSGNSFYFIPMESATKTLSVSITHDGYAAIHKKDNRLSNMIENSALLAKKN
jgi:hypothetical protein